MGLFDLFKKKNPTGETLENQQELAPQAADVLANYSANIEQRLENVHKFWQDFSQEKDAIAQLEMAAMVEHCCSILNRYFEDIVAEFELDKNNKFQRMVISANGIIKRFNDVMLLVQNAPKFPDLEVVAFRLRVHMDDFGIRMNGLALNSSEVFVKLKPNRGWFDIDIAWSKAIDPELLDTAKQMSIIMQDHLLGEYDSAVKIAQFDFIETPLSEEERKDWIVLSELPSVLDKLWLEQLGHTQVFPEGDNTWLSFEMTSREDEDDVIIGMLNKSANSVACRADLGTCLEVIMDVPSSDLLERIYQYQDRLFAELQPMQHGIHALTLFPLKTGKRTLYWYVNDELFALKTALHIGKDFPDLSINFNTHYDPCWVDYLEWLPAQSE